MAFLLCPHCHSANPATAKFCNECGAKLTEAAVSNLGAGAIATGGSVAAGQQGVAVGRDVLGDVLVNSVKNIFVVGESTARAQRWLAHYLHTLIRQSETLP